MYPVLYISAREKKTTLVIPDDALKGEQSGKVDFYIRF